MPPCRLRVRPRPSARRRAPPAVGARGGRRRRPAARRVRPRPPRRLRGAPRGPGGSRRRTRTTYRGRRGRPRRGRVPSSAPRPCRRRDGSRRRPAPRRTARRTRRPAHAPRAGRRGRGRGRACRAMLAVTLCYGRRVVNGTSRRLLALAILAAIGASCYGGDPAPPPSAPPPSPFAAAPPGGFAVVWSGADTDATTVGIGGGSFLGTQATASTLVLTITAQTADGLSTWVSSAGECEVTLEDAGPDRFAGSFACGGLNSSAGEGVEVSGSFEATR